MKGVRFLARTNVTKLEKSADGSRITASLQNRDTNEVATEDFDTVLYATGRSADLGGLNLAATGAVSFS